MTMNKSTKQQPSYVFQVEVMIENEHHATALERLLHGLNRGGFLDYRVTSGIKLGELIDERTAQAKATTAVPIVSPPASTPAPVIERSMPGLDQIRSYMKKNTLIRLIVNRGLGIKLNIPCRIINIDDQESLVTVYHVDEKQVYTFRLNEVEDFVE